MQVIALSGWANSGKDTVADYLVSKYNYSKRSFAARLKDLVAMQYDIPRSHLDDRVLKEASLVGYPVIPTDSFASGVQYMLRHELRDGYWTPRALCILEGSVKRAVHSNYWIRSIADEILDTQGYVNYVISDLRYRSEADTLRLLLPEIKIVRVDRADLGTGSEDPSERDLDEYQFDYILTNHSTKERLHENTDLLINNH